MVVSPQPSSAGHQMFVAVEQLFRAGRLADAEHLCLEALDLDPGKAEALNLLGVIALEGGNYDVAVARLRQAVSSDPTAGIVHFNLGVALAKLGRSHEAIAAFHNATAAGLQHPPVYTNLALLLRAEGRRSEAIAAMQRALELEPASPATHNVLGAMLWEEGQAEQAALHFQSAIHLKPDLADAHINLGYLLMGTGRLQEAASCLRRALDLNPPPERRCELYTALGSTYFQQNSNDDACAYFRRAVTAEPASVIAHTGLGNALLRGMRLEEAAAAYRTALELDPDCAQAHFGLGMTLLTLGDWEIGGREYEWRLRQGRQITEYARYVGLRRWNGEPAAGQVLLVIAEGGFGDTLQFCRYAAIAADRGLKVIMVVQPELMRLLSCLPGVHELLPVGCAMPSFDLFSPMISLPFILGSTPDNVPYSGGYLQPDPAKRAAWQQRLASLPCHGVRVGLVWSGNPRPGIPDQEQMNARRSLDPERLEPLFEVPGLQFFSLQKFGPRMPPSLPLIDYMEEMSDFADTAAFVANLDLVISVDSGMAHLVGALGKPVWLLSRFDACWRWLADRGDSPWYASMHIYRQPHPGAWDPVLTKVANDLRRIASSGRATSVSIPD